MFCSACSKELPAGAVACPACGVEIPGKKPTKSRASGCTIAAIVIAVSAVAFVAIVGIIAAIAIPNLLNAIDRGKQKRTMADLRTMGTAIESYSIDNNVYPVSTAMSTLETFIEPVYIRTAPLTDGWTRTFQVASAIGEYTICSGGKDGQTCTSDAGGATQSFNDSIVFSNGSFVQWPEGTQQ